MSVKQCPGCMCTEEFCDCTIMLINTREQRDKLQSELTRLSGQMGFCVLCDAYVKEQELVEKLIQEANIVCEYSHDNDHRRLKEAVAAVQKERGA